MIIIKTPNNTFLPTEFRQSTYPKIINTITTLNNLEISKEYLENNKNYPDLLNTYLLQYYSHFNNYPDSIVIVDKKTYETLEIKKLLNFVTKEIEITNVINLEELEQLINEDSNH